MKTPAKADHLDEIGWRLRVSNLEAKLELHEIEIAALTREIERPLTSSARAEEAKLRRDLVQAEWWKIKAELDEVRKLFPSQVRH